MRGLSPTTPIASSPSGSLSATSRQRSQRWPRVRMSRFHRRRHSGCHRRPPTAYGLPRPRLPSPKQQSSAAPLDVDTAEDEHRGSSRIIYAVGRHRQRCPAALHTGGRFCAACGLQNRVSFAWAVDPLFSRPLLIVGCRIVDINQFMHHDTSELPHKGLFIHAHPTLSLPLPTVALPLHNFM